MLAVPRGRARLVVVAQADGPRLLGITNWVGRTIDDLHASAAGKLLLAELDDRALAAWIRRAKPRRLTPRTLTAPGALLEELARARDRGWAEIDGESEPGLASVAVPVRDARRHPRGHDRLQRAVRAARPRDARRPAPASGDDPRVTTGPPVLPQRLAPAARGRGPGSPHDQCDDIALPVRSDAVYFSAPGRAVVS